MIKNILLGFLNYIPMTGYELKQRLDESTAHFWHAHHSQIYTVLREMEEDGLLESEFVRQEGQPDRRIYTITAQGRKMVQEWLDEPLTVMPTIKDEFIVRVFFSAQRDPQKVIAELIFQRELHQKHLADYKSQTLPLIESHACTIPFLERDVDFWRATLELGIRYDEIYIEWINDTIKMVERLSQAR